MSEAWFGAIPSHWKVVKLGDIVEVWDNKRQYLTKDSRTEGDYPCFGAGGITSYVEDYIFDEEIVLVGEDGAPFFDKTRPVAHYVDFKCWVSGHIHVLKCKNMIDARYLVAVLNSVDYTDYITGAIIPKLNQSNMKSIDIPLPPLEEQHQIVEYLYGKDTKVQLTEAQKIIADQLKHKQSIIAEYVTGKKSPSGITYDSYKDSGIDWIGEIPSDWDVVRLTDIVELQGGSQPPKNEWSENQQPGYVRMLQIRDFTGSSKAVPEYVRDTNRLKKCTESDILIGRYGASVGKILTGLSGAYNVAMIKATPLDGLSRTYMKYLLVSEIFQGFLTKLSGRSAQGGFNKEDLSTLMIPLPPLPIQQAIVAELDAVVGEADAVIANAEKLINELKAYKTAVVFECVTKGLDPTVQTKEVQAGGIV